MADYNSGIMYNEGVSGNGANYNSATYYIINVSNAGQGEILLSLIASIANTDSGEGEDSVGSVKEYDGDQYFIITTEGVLEPLGVFVLRDSRYELLPATKDIVEEVPGRHGEIDFGTELRPRYLELKVATKDGLSITQRETLKRTIAKYLNSVSGTKKMIFQDDPDVQYEVKYSGRIDLTKYASWMEFVIPFKMSKPFIESSEENTHTGDGTLENAGTFETPVLIEITGEVSNPCVSVGSQALVYTGNVPVSQILKIDTDNKTVKLDGDNALNNYNGVFPTLPPGDTIVSVPVNGTTVFKWRDRWI